MRGEEFRDRAIERFATKARKRFDEKMQLHEERGNLLKLNCRREDQEERIDSMFYEYGQEVKAETIDRELNAALGDPINWRQHVLRALALNDTDP